LASAPDSPPSASSPPAPKSWTSSAHPPPPTPNSSGTHVAPVHAATLSQSEWPPAELNHPPTSSALGVEKRSKTCEAAPLPSGAQLAPFQRAMLLAGLPPALPKPPPTKSAAPLPSSWTSIVRTCPPTPPPTLDQLAPSQRAMPFAAPPPACVKKPPA